MTDLEKKLKTIFGITSTVIDGVSGNVPAIVNAFEFLIKAYHEVRENPGNFDLDEFQKRIDALPDYEEEVK